MAITRSFASICFLLLLIGTARAGDVDVTSVADTQSLLPRMLYLPDPTSRMTLDQALAHPGWRPLTRSNQGYQRYPYWTMVSLTNSGDALRSMILRNPRSGVNYLDVYLISDLHPVRRYELGSLRQAASHPIIHRHSLVPLEIRSGETVKIVTRVQSIGPVELDWIISTVSGFARYAVISTLMFGFFGGLVVSLMLYNLSVWRSLKDNAYLLYSAMAFFSLLFQYALNGIFRVLDIGLPPMFLFASGYITSGLFMLAMVTFPVLFFKTAQTMPWMHRILIVSAGCSVIQIIINIAYLNGLLLDFWVAFMGGFFLLVASLLIVLGIQAARLGLPGARYYLLGQGAYHVAVVLQWAVIAGWVRLNEITEYFIILATMLDITFLSLALGSRIKMLSDEKNTYQTLSMAQSRFTSVGKAIGAIIHQWKVPLARLGTQITELRGCLAYAALSDFAAHATRVLPAMDRNLRDMGRTIDEFGLFYASGGEKELFRPRQVIDEILGLLQKKIEMARVAMVFDGEWEDMRLYSYPRYFSHVAMTLIDNALDILAERKITNGEIRIRLQPRGAGVVFTIEDNGGGIRFKPVSAVFNPFVSHKNGKGSGLGLPIAKMVTEERLGGAISAENSNRGARFILILPDLSTQKPQ